MEQSSDLKTQIALANKAGVGQTTISRIRKDLVVPQIDTLESIAKALGTSVTALLGKPATAETRLDRRPLSESSEPHREVPLISWVRAGSYSEAMDPYQPGDAERWLVCPVACGPRTFALRIEGESMEPEYESGGIIFVDPDVAPLNGMDVVARLDDRNEATFKRLLIEDGHKLKALNPNWVPRIMQIAAESHIAGVVIGKWVEASVLRNSNL